MIDWPSIRSARPDDVEALTTIRREAILKLAAQKMGRMRARAWANSAAPDRVRRALEEQGVYVAEMGGQAVGWIEIDGNCIKGLYVQPERAYQGIGSALLVHAEGLIRSSDFLFAVLDASCNAEQFYINRGYQPLSDRSPDLGRPMVKPLAPLAPI